MEKDTSPAASGKTKESLTRIQGVQFQEVGIALLVTAAVAWTFYDSFYGSISFLVVYPFCKKIYGPYRRKKEKEKRLLELKEILLLLASFLQVGLSIENAFLETEKEIKILMPKPSAVQLALHRMNGKIKMSVAAEKAFYDFAKEVALDEAQEFADVLYYAKRLGGNYLHHLQQTATKIEEKIEVEQEIATIMAEKQLELRIMCVMPLALLSYMKISGGQFMEPLYHSLLGQVVMTVALLIYGGMILWGRRIVSIEV